MCTISDGTDHMTALSGINAEVKALGIVLNAVEDLTEEQRQFVLRTAIGRFGIAESGAQPTKASSAINPANKIANTGVEPEASTPKLFMAAKRPMNDVQRIVCLAYFLTHQRTQQHFKTADLTKLNVEAASSKIGNPAQAVANATKISGYLTAVGGGKKQLTIHGEHVVNALPDQEAVRTVNQDQGSQRPKRRKKKDKV